MNKHEVERIKHQYPEGTRIVLDQMEDIQSVPTGTKGTVTHVDDMGTIHMIWDNGQGLGLVEGEDKFDILETKMEYENESVSTHTMQMKLTKANERMFLNDIIIQNVITLSDEDFRYFRNHLNEDYDFIRENREILSTNSYSLPCLLVRGKEETGAVIVQSDDRNMAEYYCYIPYAADIEKHFRHGIREEFQYTDAIFSRKDNEINAQHCKIEKIIELNHDDFNRFAKHLMSEYEFLKENKELMYVDQEEIRHCLLVIGNEHEHGILVDSSGASYARYTAFMQNAREYIKQKQLINLIEDIYDLDHIKEERIKVMIVKPHQRPCIESIDNTLDAKREVVQGEIEAVELSDTASLICNEEGKFIGLEANRRLGSDVIVGTFLIAGTDGSEDFCSLSDDDIELYMEKFGQVEDLSQDDIPNLCYTIYGIK